MGLTEDLEEQESTFTSRYVPGMTWPELAAAWLPGCTNEQARDLLLDATCYPAGGVEHVEPQLAAMRDLWPDVGAILARADAEMDAAWDRYRAEQVAVEDDA